MMLTKYMRIHYSIEGNSLYCLSWPCLLLLLYSPCITDWSFGIHSGHDPSKDDVAIKESEAKTAVAVMSLPDDTDARQVEVDAARARFLARKQSKTLKR
jgi:hypothetical protein